MHKKFISTVASALIVAAVAGCAANSPVRTWKPSRADAAPSDQAIARCEYETTSATQTPDYTVASIWRGVDQKQRRFDLMVLCMRVQGYEASTVSEGIGPQSEATWKQLEKDWADARAERSQARDMLLANPKGTNSEYLRQRIQQLNTEVRNLEIKLSYNLSPPVDPNVD
ncbi:hypothetical protein [Comamonas testosteroni]|uniref:hypothetical protein n=1 Tax=Comamonas testosteroni TaxID=285 RepID=UPI0026EDC40F|nr:hypothetical protein [Comamonas testosteroni]